MPAALTALVPAPFEPTPHPGVLRLGSHLLLSDKHVDVTAAVVDEERIAHVVAILPSAAALPAAVAGLPHTLLAYGDAHEPAHACAAWQAAGGAVAALTRGGANVLVLCNAGFQRSIPFLCYYLTRHHEPRAPTLEAALDTVLARVAAAEAPEARARHLAALRALPLFAGEGGAERQPSEDETPAAPAASAEPHAAPFGADAARVGPEGGGGGVEGPAAAVAAVYADTAASDAATPAAATAACRACGKRFTTAASLRRHHERFPTCVAWMATQAGGAGAAVDVRAWWEGVFRAAAEGGGTEGAPACAACAAPFASRGNLHKHLATAAVCGNLVRLRLLDAVAPHVAMV